MPDYAGMYLANPQHKVRYKREFNKVKALSIFDVWNTPPTKAYVYYKDDCHGDDMSNPIKIYQRKNGTYYVQFEGNRYDIDITGGNKHQWINEERKNKMLLEKGYYK